MHEAAALPYLRHNRLVDFTLMAFVASVVFPAGADVEGLTPQLLVRFSAPILSQSVFYRLYMDNIPYPR
jgi:hypothetical protein